MAVHTLSPRSIRAESGATIRIKKAEEVPSLTAKLLQCANSDDEMVCIEGPIFAVDTAVRGITLRLRVNANPHDRVYHDRAPPGRGPSRAPARSHREQPVDEGPEETLHLTIPSEHVGGIIGKGGSNITQIRQISGARVQLFDANDSGNRELEITGTQRQCQSAQNLVQATHDKIHPYPKTTP
eukprot:scaffold20094_cov41-Prasinocladus_malaysianus.AAC.2